MRNLDSWVDRFCAKHRRLSIPNLIKYIVIANILVYLLDRFSFGAFSAMLDFVPGYIMHGQVWRLVTFTFVSDLFLNPFLFAMSMYFTYFIGTTLEREWGSTKFTVFYGLGVVLNIIVGLLLGLFAPFYVTASMYYVNLTLLFAFSTLFPEVQFLLFFFIPVKAKWLGWLSAFFFIWDIGNSLFNLNLIGVVLPLLAILNYFIFFSSDVARIIDRARHRTSRQTTNFKKAQQHAREKKGYLHKCAVCGRTDTDSPGLEFRYCSRCNGYYCYCSDHINTHVHVE